ncbi:MAG: MarR family winged helix-turn-helix transcriptional regulator [Thermoleophilia bacterium]
MTGPGPGDPDALAASLAGLRARLVPLVLARQERRRASATPAERLTTPQHLTLAALAGGPLTMSALAAATGVAVSTATRMVQTLVREGWVEPAAVAEAGADRRRRPVRLTGAGRAVLEAADREILGRFRALVGYLDDEERAAMSAAVRAVEKAIQLDEERRASAAAAASSAASTSA